MPPIACPAPAPCCPPDTEPARSGPLAETVLHWVCERLSDQGYSLPACKRIAFLITGFIATETGTVSRLTETLHHLSLSPAKEESIGRRMLRILADERLDPERLLPLVFRDLLPQLLAEVLAAQAAMTGSTPTPPRAACPPVRVVVDETSKEDQVHLLVAGLAYQGLVLPLAARVWRQNEPLPQGAYPLALHSLLLEVHALLPAPLRAQVLLLADRAYGIPTVIDLALVLGWDWVLRVQDQTCVQRRDGRICAIRELAPTPGTGWVGGFGPEGPSAEAALADEPVAVFKSAGWRKSQVVALWAVGEKEPWLLVTSLPGSEARLRDYAERWGIERLFLSWKSHGWQLEGCGVKDPERLGRLLSGLIVATAWRLAMGVAQAEQILEELAVRAQRRAPQPVQLRLALGRGRPGETSPPERGAARPFAAKFSLLSWGAKAVRAATLQTQTPALTWHWPAWNAPRWSTRCQQVYDGLT